MLRIWRIAKLLFAISLMLGGAAIVLYSLVYTEHVMQIGDTYDMKIISGLCIVSGLIPVVIGIVLFHYEYEGVITGHKREHRRYWRA